MDLENLDKLANLNLDTGKDIRDEMHEKLASEHSRNSIFFWLITSVIYLFVRGGIAGFFSWKVLLFLILSPFIASILSIPTFWLTERIAKGLNKGYLPFWTAYIYQIFSFLYEPILAIIAIYLLQLP